MLVLALRGGGAFLNRALGRGAGAATAIFVITWPFKRRSLLLHSDPVDDEDPLLALDRVHAVHHRGLALPPRPTNAGAAHGDVVADARCAARPPPVRFFRLGEINNGGSRGTALACPARKHHRRNNQLHAKEAVEGRVKTAAASQARGEHLNVRDLPGRLVILN